MKVVSNLKDSCNCKKGLTEPFFFDVMNYLILVVLAVCWVTPDHYPPWTAFHTEAAGFCASVLALLASFQWSARTVKVPAAVLLVLLLGASAWIQYWAGILFYAGDAVVVSIYLASFAAAWLWGYQWVATCQKQDLIEYASGFLLFVGLVTAFQIAVQWLQLESEFAGWVVEGLRSGRPRANVGQPNQAATILMMGSVGVFVLRHRQRIGSAVMWVALLVLTLAITLTQSRTSLLSAAVLVVIFMVLTSRRKSPELQRPSVVLWALILYGCAWAYSSNNVAGIFAPTQAEQMIAIGTRPQIWQQLIAAVLERPWVGWGWLQIAAATQFGALSFPGVEQATFAHNIVLDVFVMLGVPIGALVFLAAGIWGWNRRARIGEMEVASAATFMLIPLAVHSMLEFPHAYIYFLIIAGLLIGALDAWSETPRSIVVSVPRWLVLCLAVVFSAVLVATCREYIGAEEDFRVNRFENVRLGETPQDYSPPRLLLLTQLNDLGKAMRLRAQPGMKHEDLELLKKVSRRYSWARLMFRTALALALNDRAEEATQQLRVIKGMFSEDVYQEARESFILMQKEKYPQLSQVELP